MIDLPFLSPPRRRPAAGVFQSRIAHALQRVLTGSARPTI
jgi:hypothetical protein